MYLEFDLATPILSEWVQTTSFKRKFFRYWGSSIVTDDITGQEVKVFDRLLIYRKGNGVIRTENNMKIYRLLGLKADELEEQNYEGIEKVYFILKGWDITFFDNIDVNDMKDIVDESTELDKEYSAIFTYTSDPYSDIVEDSPYSGITMYGGLYTNTVHGPLENDEFKALMLGGYFKIPDKQLVLNSDQTDFCFVALADANEYMFERHIEILNRSVDETTGIGSRHNSSQSNYLMTSGATQYSTTIKAKITYKRISSARLAINNSAFDTIIERGEALKITLNTQKPARDWLYGDQPGVGEPIDKWATIDGLKKPQLPGGFIDNELQTFNNKNNSMSDGSLFVSSRGKLFFKYDTFRDDVSSRDFVDLISKGFDTEIREEEASFLEKIISVVVTIVIVVVSVLAAIPSGGGSIVGATAWLSAIATFSTYMSIGIAVQMLMGMALSNMGYTAFAIFTLKMVTLLSNVTKILGYITLISGAISSITSGFMKNVIIRGVLTQVKMGTMQIVGQVLRLVNTALNFYNGYEQDKADKKATKLKAELDEQEEEMENARVDGNDLASAKMIEATQFYFDRNYYMESSEQIDSAMYQYTQGRIDQATTKYF